MIKALVVDDEPRARESITAILSSVFPEVELLGEAGGVEEAYMQIEALQPNLVLLDIKMGDGTGFDLLRRYQKVPFKVVFLTAFDEFAIEAIKFSAFDYLLKPINTVELRQTLDKLKETLGLEEDMQLKIKALLNNFDTLNISKKKIVLKTSDSIHLVNLGNIIRCEADTNYTWVYIYEQPKILISKPLKYFEELLDEYGFFRVHQSHLVNLNYFSRIDKIEGGILILSDNTSIPIAVRKRDTLYQLLENL
jgi:two-component system LytT family response regulator